MALLSCHCNAVVAIRTKSAQKSKTPQAQARWGIVIRPITGTVG
jgi:hypothetical protein